MRRKRIGNDYYIIWNILDGELHPYDLTGREFRVELYQREAPTRVIRLDEKSVELNQVRLALRATLQVYTGVYSIKYIENEGQTDQRVFDIPDVLALMPHSWRDEHPCDGVDGADILMDSVIGIDPRGGLEFKMDRVLTAVPGGIPVFDERGQLLDSGICPADKVNVSDIINALNSADPDKPLSAAQGKVLRELIEQAQMEAQSLVFDEAPEAGSARPVTSDGIRRALDAQSVSISQDEDTHSTVIIIGGGDEVVIKEDEPITQAEYDAMADAGQLTDKYYFVEEE